MGRILRVGFRRWTVEHLFRVAKQEAGLTDYEGRTYTGLLRHLFPSLLVLGFVAIRTDRLRGGKSGSDDGTGLRGVEPVVRNLVETTAGPNQLAAHGPGASLPPETQRHR